MTALAADRNINMKSRTDPQGDWIELPVAAATTIYKGSYVGLDLTGGVVPYTSPTVGTTLVGGTTFVGIADNHVDNSAGAIGASVDAKIYTDCIFQATLTAVAITDVGAPVFLTDDGTLSKDATSGLFMGRVWRYITTNTAMIRLCSQFGLNPGELILRSTPAITVSALNLVQVIPATENQNGLLIVAAWGVVVTPHAGTSQDQGIITLYHTTAFGGAAESGTTTGITITPANGGAGVAVANSLCPAILTALHGAAAAGDVLVPIPAGVNVTADVSTATANGDAAGSTKVFVLACPL